MTRVPDGQLSLPGFGPDDDEQLAAMRSEVTGRMRREWAELDQIRRAGSNMIALAAEEDDPRVAAERWRLAKLASDAVASMMRALAIKQQGERLAWGVDSGDDQRTANNVLFYLPDNRR